MLKKSLKKGFPGKTHAWYPLPTRATHWPLIFGFSVDSNLMDEYEGSQNTLAIGIRGGTELAVPFLRVDRELHVPFRKRQAKDNLLMIPEGVRPGPFPGTDAEETFHIASIPGNHLFANPLVLRRSPFSGLRYSFARRSTASGLGR